jgi:hypothetical protein
MEMAKQTRAQAVASAVKQFGESVPPEWLRELGFRPRDWERAVVLGLLEWTRYGCLQNP